MAITHTWILNLLWKPKIRKRDLKLRGFTLIECLLSLSLLILILIGTIATSSHFKRLFYNLKRSQEINQEVWAGQDKLRRDLTKAGYGLETCLNYGLILPFEFKNQGLAIYTKEAAFSLQSEVCSGSSVIPVIHNNTFTRAQIGAIYDKDKGELFRVQKVEKEKIFITQPLKENYAKGSSILAIEEIFYYLDPNDQILRRRVNASSGQPLLENVHQFICSIEKRGQIKISLVLKLDENKKKESLYEIKVFPKNAFLFQSQQF